jgi:CBS domain-containing protein
MKVKQIMTDHVITVGQREPVAHAARLMKRGNLGALPVCDDEGRLRGIVTDRDIVTRCVAADDDPSDTPVREIMSRGIVTCGAEDDADELIRTMSARQVRRVPVTEGGKVVGMVSLADLARSDLFSMEAAEALSEISSNILRK